MSIIHHNHPVEQEELMAFLDGELAVDRAAEAAAHLETCQDCRQLAADLNEVAEMMQGWQVQAKDKDAALSPALSDALGTRLLDKPTNVSARRKSQRSFLIGRSLRWVGGVAAVFVVILAISIPNLLRSRYAAEQSARARAEQQAGSDRYTPHRGLTDALPQPRAAATPAGGPAATADTGKLQANKPQVEQESGSASLATGPMIVRTAELALTTKDFDHARSSVEQILKRHNGYVGELTVSNPSSSARSLNGALRVPATRLDAALAEFKNLGHVEKESQGGEEVTARYIDLQARLTNARHTEQRLTEMLRDRTGKLSDVMAVELQISRVRGEIEQMEAERKGLKNQVDYATLNIEVNELYKEELKVVPASTSTQIRNAAIEGYHSMTDGLLGVFLWLISVLPTLLVWCLLLFFPVRFAWRKLRPRFSRELV